MEHRNYEIAHLIVRDLEGTITPEEKRWLHDWVASSPVNRAFYESMTGEELLHELHLYDTETIQIANQAKAIIEQRVPIKPTNTSTVSVIKYAVAAAILALAILAWLDWRKPAVKAPATVTFNHNSKPASNTPDTPAEIVPKINAPKTKNSPVINYLTASTSQGIKNTFKLPDGSQVWLNETSTIRYPDKFTGNERTVELTGEAYFEIIPVTDHNHKQPFVVTVKSDSGQVGKVEVLGTKFNINAYGKTHEVITTVVNGQIKIFNADTNQAVHQGQQAFWGNQGAIKTIVDKRPERAAFWRYEDLNYDGTPLPQVLKDIEKYYNVRVINNTGPEKNYTVTGKLRTNETLPNILRSIEYLCKVKTTYDADTNTVTVTD